MEINLLMTLHSSDHEVILRFTKKYESDMAPSIGAKIKDSLFAEHKIIEDVVFDYQNSKCYVTLQPKEDTKERLNDHIKEVAKLHHWELIE
jgi:hypothetical protein